MGRNRSRVQRKSEQNNTFQKTNKTILSSRASLVDEFESPDKMKEVFDELKNEQEKDMVNRLDKLDSRFQQAVERLNIRNENTQALARRRHERIEKVKLNKEKLLQDFTYKSLNDYVQSNQKVITKCKKLAATQRERAMMTQDMISKKMEQLKANKQTLKKLIEEKLEVYNDDLNHKNIIPDSLKVRMMTKMISQREKNIFRQEDAFHNRERNRNFDLT